MVLSNTYFNFQTNLPTLFEDTWVGTNMLQTMSQ